MNNTLVISILILVILPIIIKLISKIKKMSCPCCSIDLTDQDQKEITENLSVIQQLIQKFTPRTKSPKAKPAIELPQANTTIETEPAQSV